MLVLFIFVFLSIARASPFPRGTSDDILTAKALMIVDAIPDIEIHMQYDTEHTDDDTWMKSVFLLTLDFAQQDLNREIPSREWSLSTHPDFVIQVRPYEAQTIKAEYVMWGLAIINLEVLVRRGFATEATGKVLVDGQIKGFIDFKTSRQAAVKTFHGSISSTSSLNLTLGNGNYDSFPIWNATNELLSFDHQVTIPATWIGKPRIYSGLTLSLAYVSSEDDFDPRHKYSSEAREANVEVGIESPQSGARTTAPFNNMIRTLKSIRSIQVWMTITDCWYASSVDTFLHGPQISHIFLAPIPASASASVPSVSMT